MGEPNDDRKTEGKRRKQELVAEFFKENGIPVRTLPAAMIPPRYVDLPVQDAKEDAELWEGTATDLAMKVKADFKEGKIGTRSLNAAFKWASEHYIGPGERRFTEHSLRNLLNQKRRKNAGDPA